MASGSTNTSLWITIEGKQQFVTIKPAPDYVGKLALFYDNGGIAISAIVEPDCHFSFHLGQDNPHLLAHIKEHYPEMCI